MDKSKVTSDTQGSPSETYPAFQLGRIIREWITEDEQEYPGLPECSVAEIIATERRVRKSLYG